MTKTTEELKREMYKSIANLKGRIEIGYSVKDALVGVDDLEGTPEDYLEALRQEMGGKDVHIDHNERMGKVLQDAYERQQDLTSQARTEADQLRNKLQAFEFANKSAGEMLQAANEKIKRQRQSIGQLKNERDNAVHLAKVRTTQRDKLAQQLQEARKSHGAASVSDSLENDPESILRSVQRNCQHSFRQQHKFPSGKLQSECIFCLKVEG